jgi:AraC family transcriptional regulator
MRRDSGPGSDMLIELATGRRRPLKHPALLSSAAAGWSGFRLEQRFAHGFDAVDVCCLGHVVFLQLDGATDMEWTTDGRYRLAHVRPGAVSLAPDHLPYSCRSRETHRFLSLQMEPGFLAGVAAETAAREGLELRFVLGGEDPLMRELLVSLGRELELGSNAGGIYAESLATMVGAQLLRKYSVRVPTALGAAGGLDRHRLRRAIEFIHDRLSDRLTLRGIAAAVELSPYHFARQFKQAVGVTPHQYLTQARVERARDLLRRPFTSLADVALRAGFCDQSHLTRHFRRRYQLSPRAFARHAGSRKILPS